RHLRLKALHWQRERASFNFPILFPLKFTLSQQPLFFWERFQWRRQRQQCPLLECSGFIEPQQRRRRSITRGRRRARRWRRRGTPLKMNLISESTFLRN